MSGEDFPAAHSMDTEWFAVDAEGNVGHFRTGEAGAAPNSAIEDSADAPSLVDIIRVLSPVNGVEYHVDDLLAMAGGPVFDFSWRTRQYESASFSDAGSCYSILMWLADEWLLSRSSQASSLVSQGIWGRLLSRGRQPEPVRIERIANSKYLLGYTDGPLPVGTLQQWIQDGRVRKAWVNHDLSSVRIGIYEYEHGDAFENWIAGLYLRDRVPARPLKLEQLPDTLRTLVESTRFEKRSFARDAAIDPREAGECSSWGGTWVGLDGLVHGLEAEDLDEDELS